MLKTPRSRKKQAEDADLIAAIHAGRQNLFYDLAKRYEWKLYNFGLKVCWDVRDSEDLVKGDDSEYFLTRPIRNQTACFCSPIVDVMVPDCLIAFA